MLRTLHRCGDIIHCVAIFSTTLIHTQAMFFGTPKIPNKYLVPFDKHQLSLYIVQADTGAHDKLCAGGTAACPP